MVDEDDVGGLLLRKQAQLLPLAACRSTPPSRTSARFCVNLPTTSNPSVFASWRSSVSEASNSASLTLDSCTAATMARDGFWSTCCIVIHGA